MKQFYTVCAVLSGMAFFLCTQQAYCQQNEEEAWKLFFNNERSAAKVAFKQMANDPKKTAEANLGLSFLAEMDETSAASFSYFKKFYDSEPDAAAHLFALWNSPALNYNGYKKTSDQLAFYKDLYKKTSNGTIKAMCASIVGKYYENKKEYASADKEYSNIGSIDDWLITGEFENISTSGFDKTYSTLNKPEINARFINKKGVEVGWRKIPFLRHDKWVDFTYYNNYGNSIEFAQTFVKPAQAAEAQLRIGVSGSVKVWVNDQLILSEAQERNNDLDSYIQTISLHEGYNRILVQIGESYANRSNFLVRITDKNGTPLQNLERTSTPQPYVKETKFSSEAIPSVPEITFKSNNYLHKILLAKYYLRADKTFEARRIIEQIRTKYPNSTYLNIMLIELFNKEDNRTGLETAQEAIKTNDPESNIALELTYSENIKQKEFDKAEEVMKKLEKVYGESENILLKKINIAGGRQKQDELVKLIETSFAKYQDSRNVLSLKYLVEKQVKKNNSAAIGYLKKYVDVNDDYEFAKSLAEAYLNKGDAKSGLNVYRKEIENDPIAIGIYSELADQHYKLQQYDEAEKLYQKCLFISPTSSEYHSSLGKLYENTNQKDKAIQEYKESLGLSPNNYTSIKALRTLQKKKNVFDYFTQPDISEMIKKAPKSTDYPEDNFAVLNDEVQRVVYENGGSEEKHYVLTKVFNQQGIDAWKEYSVGYTNSQNLTIEVAEAIKSNGSKVPAEKNGNDLVFTNLEANDVLSIRYKIENFPEGKLASHFWDSFYFSNGSPHIQSRYSLLIAKNKTFQHVFSQKPVSMSKKSVDEFDLYVWSAYNQKGLKYEDKMPATDDVTNILYLSSIPNWQFVSDWYNDMATAKARTSYEIETTVAEIFKGKKNYTPLQKIETIYNYITKNISYSSVPFRQSGLVPQNPSTVINTRIGDCKDVATLFLALCKEVSVPVQLALVKTRDNGLNTLLLPSIDFNHCIAKVRVDNADYYLELTSNYLPFSTIYNSSLQAPILDIGEGGATLKRWNAGTRKPNKLAYRSIIELKGNDMLINENGLATGAMAGYFRETYGNLSNKDQIKRIRESMNSSYPENAISLFSLIDPNSSSNIVDTVNTKTNFELKNVAKPIGGMLIFNLPWSGKVSASSLQVDSSRYSGIDLTGLFQADEISEEFTLKLPPGKKLIEVIKNMDLTNDFIDYKISSAQMADKIIIKRKFMMKKDFVPLNQVSGFYNTFKQIAESDNQQLAIK